ncbi:MAG: branched-chain amino acid aminotransferase [Clostridia bacterium]|nr:branched-chain amino acid aminotransferase [Clostridia bacterium]
MADIKFIKCETLKAKPQDESNLGFGKLFTDYMFTLTYNAEEGWHNPTIEPFAPLSLSPASSCLHYGQTIFEGMKAYKDADSNVRLFRAKDNFARLNKSAERMCMQPVPEDLAYEGLVKLLEVEKDWIPTSEGTSLYIRPFLIGNDGALGVHAAHNYIFCIILSPVGAYYPEGLKPVKIYVEDSYVRAVIGGVGFAKTGGNYSASLLAGELAAKKGYTQVLWLDGVEHKYVEEVGAMNMFFVIDGEVITAPLLGSILPGITRDSVLKLCAELGYKASEKRLTIEEVVKAADEGRLNEAFGSGTAAVISPVGELCYEGRKIIINGGEMGEKTRKLYDTLTGIQYGKLADNHGWSIVL